MNSSDWLDPDELKRPWDGAKVRIPLDTGVIKATLKNYAGWPEYPGLNAPEAEPELLLVGEKDPWFQNTVLQGSCGEFMSNYKSESIVYKSGRLRYRHELLEYPEVQKMKAIF